MSPIRKAGTAITSNTGIAISLVISLIGCATFVGLTYGKITERIGTMEVSIAEKAPKTLQATVNEIKVSVASGNEKITTTQAEMRSDISDLRVEVARLSAVMETYLEMKRDEGN